MLSTWSKSKFTFLKTPQDFKTMLIKYLSRSYDQSFDIHAISFILDYPNSSPVRQWSHIDGSKDMFQGTIKVVGMDLPSHWSFLVLIPRSPRTLNYRMFGPFYPQKIVSFLQSARIIFVHICLNNMEPY
jgi:hypothetical protein